jgi:O-antigen/teichoic acid export membrane protein
MSRILNATRNIKYGYMRMLVQLVLGFISRTVFIHTLGVEFLGVNGLYTNILGVLSLAELGIGTAMNFSLYNPIAIGDYEKVKAIMKVYRHAYRIIALVVSVLGLSLVPFLKYIIKDPGNISSNDLMIFYLIFLFNTVITYFVAYKYSLVNAEQKNYIQTNISMITSFITSSLQIFILIVFRSFLIYLLIGAIIGLLQKIFVNIYFNKLYPYLLDKNIEELTNEEKEPIIKNVKALIYLKIGEISVYQTDNIVISSFINVATVGLISNYNMLIMSASGFISIVFSSVISSLGNMIVTENKEKQYHIFKVYRFLAFWMYGFATIAFLFLLNPFIQLWIGNNMLIDGTVICLILVNYYIVGHARVVNNIRNAAGIFDAIKYIAIIQAAVNLVVSIVLVKIIGLQGVYIGTICSTLIYTFTVPRILYRKVFKINPYEYYKDSIYYLLPVALSILSLELIKQKLFFSNTIISFVVLVFFVIIIPNSIFYLFFRKREEYHYILDLLNRKLRRA